MLSAVPISRSCSYSFSSGTISIRHLTSFSVFDALEIVRHYYSSSLMKHLICRHDRWLKPCIIVNYRNNIACYANVNWLETWIFFLRVKTIDHVILFSRCQNNSLLFFSFFLLLRQRLFLGRTTTITFDLTLEVSCIADRDSSNDMHDVIWRQSA